MKQKRFLVFLSVLLAAVSPPAQGDTYVAGQVAGTWTPAGSPYMVVADIEIPSGLTLTIQSGVQVKFTGHFKLTAHGTLTAVGAPGDSIIFTHHLPYENYTWAGIYFEGTQGTSDLAYCILEWGYAQGSVGQASSKGGAMHVLNSLVNVHHCRLSNNKADIKGAAIYVNNSANTQIYNNVITNNTCYGDGGGIFIEFAVNPYVHENLIKYNVADNGAGVHFVYTGGTIENNNIHHNTATSSNGAGILCDHASPIVVGNILNHNTSSGSSGTGIYCHHYSSPTILYNEICWNNFAGIYCGDNSSPQIDNNTIFGNNSYAIRTYLNSNPFGRNNIATGNLYAFYVSFGCSVYMTYCDIQGGWAGVGNIDLQPCFVNVYSDDFDLLPYSPCIDTGSPLAPLDPDSTVADMGAHYFDQNQPQGICTITLTPIGAPIILPPRGGTVWYGLEVQNSVSYYNRFDLWVNLQQPDSQTVFILLRNNLYLAAGASLTRTLSLTVNATAMPGTYTVSGYVGDYPNIIEDFDSFTFIKSPAGDAESGAGGTVTVSGWGETETISLKSSLPQRTELLGHYPEPFNPQTSISFRLAAGEHVTLQIYNITGQKIATLLDRNLIPGLYHETFNGQGLASGVYFYKLKAGPYQSSGKMMLLK